MLIVCPSCRHAIRVVDLRPGRFTPRCPRCQQVFQITVPEERGRAPVIIPLDPSVFAEPVFLEPPTEPTVEVPDLFWPAPMGWTLRAEIRPRRLPRGIPRFLGRHVLLRLLGSGPRGQALLGLPLSLDENEVIKVQDSDRAAQRVFVARFTREAYAASQIEHPNLVEIRDLGFDRGRYFAVVERVPGPSLAELLEEPFPFEPHHAAVLILQAARGLRAAHDQGLCHRDVKPENLLLDPGGLVKVDDLGLEMTPSLAEALARRDDPKRSPVPTAPPAAGSPVYMAPEQASDAAHSDGRADIYALGGTFYNLVTGRPPFSGQSAVELIRQHREERLTPPREFAPKLPEVICDIIQTMLGKRLEERYPTMGSVVDVLEKALELRGDEASVALEEAGESIREAASTLARSPARRLRFRIMAMGCLIVLAFVCLLLYLRLPGVAAGIAGFAAIATLAVLIPSGILHKSELLRLTSHLVLGGGRRSWVVLVLILALSIGALWIWGGFVPWLLLVCAGGLAAAFHVFLDRPLARERQELLSAAVEKLRKLRARGHDEQTLRSLFFKHGGANWQELFEPLFGRRAALAARAQWGEGRSAGRRGSVASIRDALCWVLERRLEVRRNRHVTRLLEQVEEGRFEAAGANLLTARRKARRAAKALVVTAQCWRDEQRLLDCEDRSAAAGAASLMERLDRSANEPERALESQEPQRSPLLRRSDSLLSLLLGRGVRLLLGGGLFVLFAVWLDAKGILTFRELQVQAIEIGQVIDKAVHSGALKDLGDLRWNLTMDWRRLNEPVDFSGLKDAINPQLPAANLATAALILLLSASSGRKFTGFWALLGAALCLFGPRWGLALPALGGRVDGEAQARYLGCAILLLGFFWPRRKTSS